jgi:hypothetical protein
MVVGDLPRQVSTNDQAWFNTGVGLAALTMVIPPSHSKRLSSTPAFGRYPGITWISLQKDFKMRFGERGEPDTGRCR